MITQSSMKFPMWMLWSIWRKLKRSTKRELHKKTNIIIFFLTKIKTPMLKIQSLKKIMKNIFSTWKKGKFLLIL